ncbi:hypothetical protein ACFL96_20300 [Thermoproteota archaeon]
MLTKVVSCEEEGQREDGVESPKSVAGLVVQVFGKGIGDYASAKKAGKGNPFK